MKSWINYRKYRPIDFVFLIEESEETRIWLQLCTSPEEIKSRTVSSIGEISNIKSPAVKRDRILVKI
jgi:hypothetical protein